MQNFNIQNASCEKRKDIQVESKHVSIISNRLGNFNKVEFMLKNMHENHTYKHYLKKINSDDSDKRILKEFKKRYEKYRYDWLNRPEKEFKKNKINSYQDIENPLCVDIETAALCNLGCPHCFRETLMTPDKIMSPSLFKKVIDSISELDVPSIKLNWRGEPLLHPHLTDFIIYAKKNGVIETMMNTNATELDEKMSKKLINAGLDNIIFSFDGGTMDTYNKMRPGRFKKNEFENVYKNIQNFSKIRKKLGSKFPLTKIQMVLTKDTRSEIESFYELFTGYVDDISVIQYNERGGKLSDINEEDRARIKNFLEVNKMDKNTPYMVTADEKVYVSKGRRACPQLFQRLMITYDGKVGMCCNDWGAQHAIGYVDKEAFNEDKEIEKLARSIEKNKKGFELLSRAKRPTKFNDPTKKVENIIDIWKGKELNKVRDSHTKNELDQVGICKLCTSRETYDWAEVK